MEKDEWEGLKGLVGGQRVKKEEDFKESDAAKKQMATLMGFSGKKIKKAPPPKAEIHTRQYNEKKLEKDEFPVQIKDGMMDVIGVCHKEQGGILINYFAVKLITQKVRISLSTPAGNPSIKEIREIDPGEFEKEFTIGSSQPKEDKGKELVSVNILGLYCKSIKGTMDSGGTARESNIDIKYHASLLADGRVRVAMASPSGKPTKIDVQDISKEEFEKEFTISNSRSKEDKGGDVVLVNVLGLYCKSIKGTVGSGGTARESNIDIKYHASLLADGRVRVAMASPSGKPTKIDVQDISREEFDKQFTQLDVENK